MKRILMDIKTLLVTTFNKALDDDIVTQGAAIAFYTIFSIAPLFILIVGISGFFFSEAVISGQLEVQLNEYLGEETADNLTQFIEDRAETPTSIWASIAAGIIIIFGATTVISQLKSALNKIWNIHEIKINSIWSFVLNRLISFGMIIILSILLVASMLAEGVIRLTSDFIYELFPHIPMDFYMYLTQITTIAFAVLFFTLIFKILPDVHARWKDVTIGAVVTTLLFILGKYLIEIYLSTAGIESTYRAAGTLVVFVIWVYYNVQTILFGAVFTQVYTEMFGGRILPYKFVEMERMTNFYRLKDADKTD